MGVPEGHLIRQNLLLILILGKLHYLWDEGGGGIRRSGRNFLDERFVVGEFFRGMFCSGRKNLSGQIC